MRLTIGMITLVPFGTTKESPGICHSLVQVLPVKATGASLRPSLITLTLNFMRPLSDLTLSVVGGAFKALLWENAINPNSVELLDVA